MPPGERVGRIQANVPRDQASAPTATTRARIEQVDELLQVPMRQALQRWLSTDWWARKRPNVMTLR